MTTSVEVKGECDDRFTAVQEAFAKNFEDGLELGASFAATLNGEFVVDIWAGHADASKSKAWGQDTIVNVWSSTKLISFLCMLMLVERGQQDRQWLFTVH
jgi:CubicO group peptidase (beta-lactamase class C family)